MQLFSLFGEVLLKGDEAAKKALGEIDNRASGVGERLQKMGGRVSAVGGTMTKWVTGPILGAAAGLFALTNKAAGMGDEIAKTSTKLGVSTDALQEMHYWASQNGIESSALERAVGRLNQRVGRAAAGNEKYAEAFHDLGVEIVDANGNIRDTEDVMQDTIAALREIEDPAARSAAAAEVFGTKMARDLMPALEDTSLSLEDAAERAHELGAVMSEESVRASEDYTDAMDDLNRTFGGLWRGIAEKFIPILTNDVIPIVQDKVIPAISAFTDRVIGLIDWFMELDPTWQKVIGYAVAFFVAIGPILLVVGKLIAVMGALISPTALVVVAIAGLIAMLVHAYQTNEEFRDRVIAVFERVRDFVTTAIEVIRSVIQRVTGVILAWWAEWGQSILDFAVRTWEGVTGVLRRAVELIVAVIQRGVDLALWLWGVFGDTILSAWQLLWGTVESILIGAWTIIREVIQGALSIISGILDVFIGLFTGDWERLWDGVRGILDGAVGIITGIFGGLWTALEGIYKAFAEFFGRAWDALKDVVVDIAQAIWDGIQERIQGLITWAEAAWDTFTSTLETAWDLLWGAVETVLRTTRGIIEGIIGAFIKLITGDWKGFTEDVRGAWDSLWSGVKGIIRSARDTIVGIVGGIIDRVKGALDWIDRLFRRNRESVAATTRGLAGDVTAALDGMADTVVHQSIIPEMWAAIGSATEAGVKGMVGAVKGGQESVSDAMRALKSGAGEEVLGMTGSLSHLQDRARGHFDGVARFAQSAADRVSRASQQIAESARTAAEYLKELEDALARIPEGGVGSIPVRPTGDAPTMDTGGVVEGPGMFWVGRGVREIVREPDAGMSDRQFQMLLDALQGTGAQIELTANYHVTDRATAEYANEDLLRTLQVRGVGGSIR